MGSNENQDKGAYGLFQRLLSFIIGDNDPDREKKRLLKDVKKVLRKKGRYFKVQGNMVQPGLVSIFYDAYKTVSSAQVFLETAQQSKALKNIVIESIIPSDAGKKIEALSEESIREKSKTLDMKSLQSYVKTNLVEYYAAFDSEAIKKITSTYTNINIFLNLVKFDYYFLMKKFDSRLPERDFVYRPKFEAINGEYIIDDLKDFMEILPSLSGSNNWDTVFDVLKMYKNMEVVDRNSWKKTFQSLKDLYKSRLLEFLIMYIDNNPFYTSSVSLPEESIVENYLDQIKTNSELIVQKIAKEKRTSLVDQLLTNIYGTTAISRLRNYTDKANITFSKKMLGGYIYINPLNYTKAFFLDYFKKDVKDLVDLLIIKGEWSTKLLSQQLSETFQNLMTLSDVLLKFDESLAEDGELGAKIKASMRKSDRDKNGMTILRQQLKEINEQAYAIIARTSQDLISMGKSLKMVVEDKKKPKAEVIINWKELQSAHDGELEKWMSEIYKKIYYFVQLIHIFLKKK